MIYPRLLIRTFFLYLQRWKVLRRGCKGRYGANFECCIVLPSSRCCSSWSETRGRFLANFDTMFVDLEGYQSQDALKLNQDWHWIPYLFCCFRYIFVFLSIVLTMLSQCNSFFLSCMLTHLFVLSFFPEFPFLFKGWKLSLEGHRFWLVWLCEARSVLLSSIRTHVYDLFV